MKKHKPVAIFDIDGTIFRNSLFIELHWKMVKEGIIPRAAIARLDKKYWNWVTRQGEYEDYLSEVIASFNRYIDGVPVRTMRRLAAHVVKHQSNIVYRYTRDLIESVRKTHTLVAISGSQDIVVKEFTRAWGFDYYIGTEHEVRGTKFTKKILRVPSLDKRQALVDLQAKHGFVVGRGSIGVGDTESDVKIFEMVERPICFNPTRELYQIAARRGWEVVVERKNAIYSIKDGRVSA